VTPARPHLLGIDDAPFEKRQREPVPIVAVMMEGADLVESVAVSAFAVDGDDATGFLADWIGGLRALASAQAILLGGITIAGLGVVDVEELARRLTRPVLVVTRREPSDAQLAEALAAAGLADRIPILAGSPRARRVADGLFLAQAGATAEDAAHLVRAALGKAQLPEPLRVAHLVGRALVLGESRGRV
jgi:endonuclease V-like protein UPF0215 family